MVLRKKVLVNKSEEYRLCLSVLSYYAIHFYQISFFCRKVGNGRSDLQTDLKKNRKDTIQVIYGKKIANSLVDFYFFKEDFGVSVNGLISSPMENIRKSEFILFINDRLVENRSIQRTVNRIYDKIAKRKGKSFVYLSLKIKGKI